MQRKRWHRLNEKEAQKEKGKTQKKHTDEPLFLGKRKKERPGWF